MTSADAGDRSGPWRRPVLAGIATTRVGVRDTADVYAAAVAVVAAAATAGYALRARRNG